MNDIGRTRSAFLDMVCIAGLACLLWQCQSGSLDVGQAVPEIQAVNLQGKKVVIPKDSSGKIVLLHFGTGSCPACIYEMPFLESLYHDYAGQGLIPCSVAVGDTKMSVEHYLRKMTISYPVVVDEASASRRACGISLVPVTFIVDRKGVVKFRIVGPTDRSHLEVMIKTLLSKQDEGIATSGSRAASIPTG